MLQCEERISNQERRREESPRSGTSYGAVHEREMQAGALRSPPERVAQALGVFSVALGLVELAAPHALARAIGLANGRGRASRVDHGLLLRLFGLREIATGAGILSRRRPAGWLWARVAGDILDLSFLGGMRRNGAADPARLAAAATAVAGVTAVDVLCGQKLRARRSVTAERESDGSLRLASSIAVNRPPAECYAFWRRPQNLPHVVRHLESVQETGEARSHFRLRTAKGTRVEWDTELAQDQANELIAWRAVDGAGATADAVLRFLPGLRGDGTIVRATLRYKPSDGAIAARLKATFGEVAAQQLKQGLRRFKQVLETGEIITTEGQSHGPARFSLTRALSAS